MNKSNISTRRKRYKIQEVRSDRQFPKRFFFSFCIIFRHERILITESQPKSKIDDSPIHKIKIFTTETEKREKILMKNSTKRKRKDIFKGPIFYPNFSRAENLKPVNI